MTSPATKAVKAALATAKPCFHTLRCIIERAASLIGGEKIIKQHMLRAARSAPSPVEFSNYQRKLIRIAAERLWIEHYEPYLRSYMKLKAFW